MATHCVPEKFSSPLIVGVSAPGKKRTQGEAGSSSSLTTCTEERGKQERSKPWPCDAGYLPNLGGDVRRQNVDQSNERPRRRKRPVRASRHGTAFPRDVLWLEIGGPLTAA
ncbi:uncharacterized protein [Dermacentor andersoni]|uniref:uncharacterized protein n=1 Tax=Dermacentor andersoni TaxID=34620 RepID=UPI0024163E4F|nr:uncharacterized protein LOC129384038 [Dermacentor andersoni]